MQPIRLIPSLSLAGEDFVQTLRYRERQYVGDPINILRIFNEKMVDEISITDIDATRSSSTPNYRLLEDMISECFMPVSYGGGVRSLNQARRLFDCGIEKIALNSVIQRDPEQVLSIVREFGSQSVTGVIDYIVDSDGHAWNFDYVDESPLGNLIDAVIRLTALGVGEIRINNVRADGALVGLDLETIRDICSKVDVPVIASGGMRDIQDVSSAQRVGAGAVAAGAGLVLYGPHRAVLVHYPHRDF